MASLFANHFSAIMQSALIVILAAARLQIGRGIIQKDSLKKTRSGYENQTKNHQDR
jgi:hypothetical protein